MKKLLLALVTTTAIFAIVPTAQAKLRIVDTKCPVAADVQLKILGAKGEYEGVMTEYVWLEMFRPGFKRDEQAHFRDGKRDYDLLYISKGRKKQILCFDITDFFGKSP